MLSTMDKVNILLVDDRPENLLALEAIIEREDYHLIKASSGEEALKYLLRYDFAAILLDVQMPGIDGFETAKIIKAREKSKNIPIIFITANNMDSQHIFTGYFIGAIDYILKPFDPYTLKSKVQGFVDIYKLNQKLIQQTESLVNKTSELESAYKDLSNITTDLRRSEALANVISETSMDAMFILNHEGTIIKINPAVFDLFLYKEEDLLGKSMDLLLSSEGSTSYLKNFINASGIQTDFTTDEKLVEVTAVRKNQSTFAAEMLFGKTYIEGECIIACTIRDVTKKKESDELITYMAYHDGLTDLPNRRLFNDKLNVFLHEAKQQNHSLTMMYLDMDRFKYINDSLGHLIGDKLLQLIAKRLKNCTRKQDFVARIGGDEFNVLLPNTNRESALELAEILIEAFKEPFYLDNYELFITTSIGISVFPYDGEDSLSLMRHADAALYRAKEQGKNKYQIFHSGMNIQSYKTFVLQNDLRKAIDNQELRLLYQPRVDVETGVINSVEALVRWKHPHWGLISPVEFIPLAEETGLIVEIGEWVLRTACIQSKEWQKRGNRPIRMAVNFSAKQFLKKDIIQKMEQILEETGLHPEWLEVEITESSIMQNEEMVTKALSKLKSMGIRISIDDFGTGYSSLNYLRLFPVHSLKIDKSFIQDLSFHSTESTALISSIISLAHSLNMSVVAEGVETKEQWMVLKQMNCEEIQGFLFSPPVEWEELELHLEKEMQITSYDAKSEQKKDSKEQIMEMALDFTQEAYSLSNREFEVFKLIVNGLSNKEISEELFISEHTVKNHITRIFQKLNVNDRLQAMAKVYDTCIQQHPLELKVQ